MSVFLALAVFCSAATVDYAHVMYARARDQARRHRAALWSVGQWLAASVGFVLVVKVSLWLLIAEGAGLYCGTWLAVGGQGSGQAFARHDEHGH